MKRLVMLGVAAVALFAAAVSNAHTAGVAKIRACGIVRWHDSGGLSEDTVYVRQGKISCGAARNVIYRLETGGLYLPGWNCSFLPGTSLAMTCRRHGTVIRKRPYTPPPPKPPPTITNPAVDVNDNFSDRLTIGLSSATFCPAGAAPTAVTVTVKDGNDQATTTTDTSTCINWNPPYAFSSSSSFRLSAAPDIFLSNSLGLEVDPSFSSGEHHMLYVIQDPQGVLAQGAFTVDTTAGHQAFEGSDEFVNFCIDQSQTIYSSNGRLYCNVPASYSVSLGWTFK